MTAIEQALTAAWTGADPGPTILENWPPSRRRFPPGPAQELPRHPASGLGPLLDLSLAGDPARKVGGVRLRRVPSAGGRYPVNAYLGAAYYDPITHTLHGPPGNTITLALQPQRTTWRYGPRALPVLLLDLGHALAAILTAARTLGIPANAAFTPQPPRHGEYPLATVHLGLSTKDKVDPPIPAPLPDPPALPLIEDALTELSAHPATPLPWQPPDVTPETLLARRTAPWPTRGPITLPGHGLTAVRPTEHLALSSCGQPELANAELLLLATGEPEPLNFVQAGMAVHRAWLLATAAGLSVRPVGCWIRARHDGRRVLHALAVGP
ncbi:MULTISPECIES: hypothetical protein [unclassified Crossiella]|uniref:hypothetical protein n=1 Tax=unclassified Crossiella TaxID=2620835 RepID=UPI001FFFC9A8|nr:MULTISPECIES: hypothetical protein [unclassified Crossiella]MCK2237555.1 hypothetical protein [Crossiella sp. S99.2]MCK2254841.1 hypothetical protein [Crossiella sp. S99.1]